MFALAAALVPQLLCRDYAKVKEMSDRFVALADEKRAAMWKAYSVMFRGSLLALTGSGADDAGPDRRARERDRDAPDLARRFPWRRGCRP